MTARLPFAPPHDHLVYLRVFEGCNLHCEHCFIPANPKRMTLAQMDQVADLIRAVVPAHSRILLQWHGGEPTMFGAAWLEEAIARVEAGRQDLYWEHGIQTNLMTYDADWASLYRRRFAGEVGVSWDPGIRLLRRGRPETNAAYEQKFWANFAQLVADRLDPYLVITFTRTLVERYPNPLDLFQELESRGVRRVHFERITETGYARENWGRLGLDNAGYAHAMSRFLRSYLAFRRGRVGAGRPVLNASPFDGLMASVRRLRNGQAGGYGCWSGACDTRFHTIDANGYKRGCTALTSEVDNPRAAAALSLPDLAAARAARTFDCTSCRFRSVCSSGCLALSMDDGSGACSGGYRLFETATNLCDYEMPAEALSERG